MKLVQLRTSFPAIVAAIENYHIILTIYALMGFSWLDVLNLGYSTLSIEGSQVEISK